MMCEHEHDNGKFVTDGMQAKESATSVVEGLQYSELMKPYQSTIEMHFSGREAMVYRSVSLPAKESDLLPRRMRRYESIAEAVTNYNAPNTKGLEDAELLKQLNQHYGRSVFSQEEGLRAVWQKGFGQKETPRDIRKYKEDMGEAMVRLKINGLEDGLLQNENEIRPDGHHNFLPANSFVLEEHIDREYGYNGYMPFLAEDIKRLEDEENANRIV